MKPDAIIIGKHKFDTLVAVTSSEHEHGLMHKEWPPPAMVFPYEISGIRKFWMKNTPSPLDILFCDGNQIVGIFKGEPNSCVLVGPNVPTDLVIELPFGTAAQYGLNIGQSVNIKYSFSTLIKKINYKFGAII